MSDIEELLVVCHDLVPYFTDTCDFLLTLSLCACRIELVDNPVIQGRFLQRPYHERC